EDGLSWAHAPTQPDSGLAIDGLPDWPEREPLPGSPASALPATDETTQAPVVASGSGPGDLLAMELEAYTPSSPDSALGLPVDMVVGLKVLVAEDDLVNQLVVRAVLEQLGHRCDVVEDGAQVVAQVQAEPYDLVLMDIQMPGMDGVAAARAIRALPLPLGAIPIVALTANAMIEDRSSYLAAGMNDYVSKPVSAGRLAQALGRAVSPASQGLGQAS
ncbi:MAG: Signal transduction histidine-protein kinase BarA, partial [Pseudomonadota bacterium]